MELPFGYMARWGRFVTAEIPLGHTFALRPVAEGAEIVEYAVTTGIATRRD